MAIGTILAVAISCAALWSSTRTFRNLKSERNAAHNAAEIADLTEKLDHLTKIFKRLSARQGQRKRRENERENGVDREPDYDENKRALRARHAGHIRLDKRR